MTVYFVSGQAADETLFENLTLPSHFAIKHVHWIEPLKKEPFADYVERLAQQINANESFALVGVSLGGMVAIELNKILQPKLTIIIYSIAREDWGWKPEYNLSRMTEDMLSNLRRSL